MTPNKEDYLKIIYELGGNQKKVNNKDIVSAMKVSAASVSEMMNKLLTAGYITYTPYQGVQLSEKGISEAEVLVRKHRLWEVFLVEKMGYDWSEVHEEAELLEHVTSDKLVSHLNSYLDFPKTCPHGDVIPQLDDQQVMVEELVTLDTMMVGQTGFLKRVIDDKELLNYLVEINLKIGDSFEICQIGSYEGPIKISKAGMDIYIGRKAASRLFVALS